MYRRPVTGFVLALSSTLVIDVLRGYFLRLFRALATVPTMVNACFATNRLFFARERPSLLSSNVKRLFHSALPLAWTRANRRDSTNLYRTLDVWSTNKRREEKRRERNFNINICKGPCCCSRYVDAWPNNCGWNGTKIFGTFKRDCWNVCLSYIGERMKIQMLSIVCLKILLLTCSFKFNRFVISFFLTMHHTVCYFVLLV